ncbi:hypothetical protein TWF694_003392 [Orbilia ellipsospora]|uniref:Uncharacterized protein n=1 Tax=Orbilia ellipsospora TaxID=2528407 RepID=A0AAV9WY30_9PEZI
MPRRARSKSANRQGGWYKVNAEANSASSDSGTSLGDSSTETLSEDGGDKAPPPLASYSALPLDVLISRIEYYIKIADEASKIRNWENHCAALDRIIEQLSNPPFPETYKGYSLEEFEYQRSLSIARLSNTLPDRKVTEDLFTRVFRLQSGHLPDRMSSFINLGILFDSGQYDKAEAEARSAMAISNRYDSTYSEIYKEANRSMAILKHQKGDIMEANFYKSLYKIRFWESSQGFFMSAHHMQLIKSIPKNFSETNTEHPDQYLGPTGWVKLRDYYLNGGQGHPPGVCVDIFETRKHSWVELASQNVLRLFFAIFITTVLQISLHYAVRDKSYLPWFLRTTYFEPLGSP